MAVKRKAPPPPPPPQDSSSDESSDSDSSSDGEDQRTKPPQRPAADDDDDETEEESSDEEEEETDSPKPPEQRRKPPHRPAADETVEGESSSENSAPPAPKSAPKPAPGPAKSKTSSAENDEVEPEKEPEEEAPEEEENPESEPVGKKRKLSAAATVRKKDPFLRLWSEKDEMTLLRALSQYLAKNGKLPSPADYASFLPTIIESIEFPVDVKRLSSKIRSFRQKYRKTKEKGNDAKFSKPHDKRVFDMSTKLFNCTKVGPKHSGIRYRTTDTETEEDSGVPPAKSNCFLGSFVEDMIRKQQIPNCLTVKAVVAQVGESRAREMNVEIKILGSKILKLQAELIGTVGEMMASYED